MILNIPDGKDHFISIDGEWQISSFGIRPSVLFKMKDITADELKIAESCPPDLPNRSDKGDVSTPRVPSLISRLVDIILELPLSGRAEDPDPLLANLIRQSIDLKSPFPDFHLNDANGSYYADPRRTQITVETLLASKASKPVYADPYLAILLEYLNNFPLIPVLIQPKCLESTTLTMAQRALSIIDPVGYDSVIYVLKLAKIPAISNIIADNLFSATQPASSTAGGSEWSGILGYGLAAVGAFGAFSSSWSDTNPRLEHVTKRRRFVELFS